jgi:hypothetical protein
VTLNEFLPRLENVTPRGSRYMATCPAHSDKHPSLQITEGERGLLLKCWSGCTLAEICASLQLTQQDLFYDGRSPTPRGHRRIDRKARAFEFELAALDLRLRAERIVEAGKQLNVDTLDNDELDHALSHAAQAHEDVKQAERFEQVADHLRMTAYLERQYDEEHRRIA